MQAIYQLRITLRGIRPPIWRQVQVLSDLRLHKLHTLIQVVMGWSDCHLHEFAWQPPLDKEAVGVRRGRPDERIFMPAEALEEIDGAEDESQITVGELMSAPKDELIYVYDHGDNWIHEVKLQKILKAEPGTYYPRCVGGKRACPPEDCGGAPGYEDLLVALRDPDHEQHAELLAWVGEGFDSEWFEVAEAEALVKKLKL